MTPKLLKKTPGTMLLLPASRGSSREDKGLARTSQGKWRQGGVGKLGSRKSQCGVTEVQEVPYFSKG
jgi:hypothetical protein